jgi:hypothetical protein
VDYSHGLRCQHSASAVFHVKSGHAIHISAPNAMRGSERQPFGRGNLFPSSVKETGEASFKSRDFDVRPLLVIWEMTQVCDLKCMHCRAIAQPHRHALELSTNEAFKLVDQVANMRVRIGATRKLPAWERIIYESTSLNNPKVGRKKSEISDSTYTTL